MATMVTGTTMWQNTTSNSTCVGSCTKGVDSNLEEIYVVLTAVMAGLSMFGGTSICILYIVFKDLRTPGRKLLFFLAFSDALLALGNLLGIIWFLYSDSEVIHKSEGYCDFQSAMTIYFSIVSFSWTVIMGTTLFATVVLNKQNFTSTYMKLFHIIAWIPGAIITVIAWSLGVLGTDTTLDQASWCWIDPRVPHALLWQFATGKFFEILCYIVTVVLYSAIKIFLARQSNKMIGKGKKKSKKDIIADANRKLTFVPLVFIVCRIWGTLRFLIGNFGQDIVNEPYVTWINPLQGIGDSAQGFANFVIYCFSTESIRQRMFPCFRNTVDVAEISGLDPKSRFTRKSSVTTKDQPAGSSNKDVMKTSKTANISTGLLFSVVTDTSYVEHRKETLNGADTADTVTRIDSPPTVSALNYVTNNERDNDANKVEEFVDTQEMKVVNSDDNINVVNKTNEYTNEVESTANTSRFDVDKVKGSNSKLDTDNSLNKEETSHEDDLKIADGDNKPKLNDNKSDVNQSDVECPESHTLVVMSNTETDEGSKDVIDTPYSTSDTGGVYLGTKETVPSMRTETVVQVTPPQLSDNQPGSNGTDSESQKNTSTNANVKNIPHLSVAVDIHNRNANGLVEISD